MISGRRAGRSEVLPGWCRRDPGYRPQGPLLRAGRAGPVTDASRPAGRAMANSLPAHPHRGWSDPRRREARLVVTIPGWKRPRAARGSGGKGIEVIGASELAWRICQADYDPPTCSRSPATNGRPPRSGMLSSSLRRGPARRVACGQHRPACDRGRFAAGQSSGARRELSQLPSFTVSSLRPAVGAWAQHRPDAPDCQLHLRRIHRRQESVLTG